ncbi:MAG: uroporphyrinogen decarboxylase family protein [Armatimonadota bacterium]|nr:uroporphyrinogen decarboxylase family protein [Armatimonadota bacterium]
MLGENAQLALDTILHKPVKGIPTCAIFAMQRDHIERIAGAAPGEYEKRPEEVYTAMQRAAGVCIVDQFIPTNPLSMGEKGYENVELGATTGAEEIVRDGITIDSPEAVVEHMERFVFPSLLDAVGKFDAESVTNWIIADHDTLQEKLGPNILKTGYGGIAFPCFHYGIYGYENYFMAYALYPEVMEKHFSLQADLALLNNHAAAEAYAKADLPPLHRLDFDMADSRGTLVDVKSLDRIWVPHFARCLEPLLKTDLKMIWHCDGNLMEMVPRLLEVGLKGFQGFQYECGMDYEKICAMKTEDGENLTIIGGVSVTTTLPLGTPDDVKQEMAWLVEKGPKTGLFLGVSSSITPGVPWENMETLLQGFDYYRIHGRG